MLVDRLGAIGSRKMTATEVLERSAEMTRLLGATYGRLQAELLTPLLTRAHRDFARRGEIPDLTLDGRVTDLQYKSPLARTSGPTGRAQHALVAGVDREDGSRGARRR